MSRPLSRTSLDALGREVRLPPGLRLFVWSLAGDAPAGADPLAAIEAVRRARTLALHESVTRGGPEVFWPLPGLLCGVVPLETDRVLKGGLLVGEVREPGAGVPAGADIPAAAARRLRRRPALEGAALKRLTDEVDAAFYRMSGWRRPLLEENRLRDQRQRQLADAIAAQEKAGGRAVYPFEKERLLLSFIKAGDREHAMRVLNEMLAAMYLTSPQLPVLRARAVELMGYLARAAVEDSPALEPLIEHNHGWMARLIQAPDFEELSRVLTRALDDFIEGIYREGRGRGHPRVSQALDFITARYTDAISLRDVARAAGVSPFRLARLTKQYTGRTVLSHIVGARVKRAMVLLETTAKNGAEIAYESGFGDQSALIRQFKKACGLTPGRWRRGRWRPA